MPFCSFSGFFTGRKKNSRLLFLKIPRVVQSFHGYFLRFFHGLKLNFHGLKNWDVTQFFRVRILYFFHAKRFVFHGLDFADFSREGFLFHGLFLRFFHGKDQAFTGRKLIFPRVTKNFSRGKKKHCT